jgi:hypothetical protein
MDISWRSPCTISSMRGFPRRRGARFLRGCEHRRSGQEPSRTARAALCLASTPTRSASGCWRVIGIVFLIDQPIAARRPSRVREPPVAPGTPARPGSSSRGIFLPPSAAGPSDWRHSLASGRPRGSTALGARVPACSRQLVGIFARQNRCSLDHSRSHKGNALVTAPTMLCRVLVFWPGTSSTVDGARTAVAQSMRSSTTRSL